MCDVLHCTSLCSVPQQQQQQPASVCFLFRRFTSVLVQTFVRLTLLPRCCMLYCYFVFFCLFLFSIFAALSTDKFISISIEVSRNVNEKKKCTGHGWRCSHVTVASDHVFIMHWRQLAHHVLVL